MKRFLTIAVPTIVVLTLGFIFALWATTDKGERPEPVAMLQGLISSQINGEVSVEPGQQPLRCGLIPDTVAVLVSGSHDPDVVVRERTTFAHHLALADSGPYMMLEANNPSGVTALLNDLKIITRCDADAPRVLWVAIATDNPVTLTGIEVATNAAVAQRVNPGVQIVFMGHQPHRRSTQAEIHRVLRDWGVAELNATVTTRPLLECIGQFCPTAATVKQPLAAVQQQQSWTVGVSFDKERDQPEPVDDEPKEAPAWMEPPPDGVRTGWRVPTAEDGSND